jgi:hypothetical protein
VARVKMSRKALVARAVLGVMAFSLIVAPASAADSVWVQSYQRASQSEACAPQTGETQWQDSWGTDSNWNPTWERWANGGQGGWTCTRSITWARSSNESVPSGAELYGCLLTTVGFTAPRPAYDTWANWGSRNYLSDGAASYMDAACTVPDGGSYSVLDGRFFGSPFAYATDTVAAQAICLAQFPGTVPLNFDWLAPHIYNCAAPG